MAASSQPRSPAKARPSGASRAVGNRCHVHLMSKADWQPLSGEIVPQRNNRPLMRAVNVNMRSGKACLAAESSAL